MLQAFSKHVKHPALQVTAVERFGGCDQLTWYDAAVACFVGPLLEVRTETLVHEYQIPCVHGFVRARSEFANAIPELPLVLYARAALPLAGRTIELSVPSSHVVLELDQRVPLSVLNEQIKVAPFRFEPSLWPSRSNRSHEEGSEGRFIRVAKVNDSRVLTHSCQCRGCRVQQPVFHVVSVARKAA